MNRKSFSAALAAMATAAIVPFKTQAAGIQTYEQPMGLTSTQIYFASHVMEVTINGRQVFLPANMTMTPFEQTILPPYGKMPCGYSSLVLTQENLKNFRNGVYTFKASFTAPCSSLISNFKLIKSKAVDVNTLISHCLTNSINLQANDSINFTHEVNYFH